MLTLIETYDQDFTRTIEGRTFPSCCLVEDEDGLRLLVLPSNVIPVYLWVQAHMAGAAALLLEHPSGWYGITAESFMEDRWEHQDTYQADNCPWVPLATLTYRAVLEAQRRLLDEVAAEQAGWDERGFVHLHTHTEYSALDGLSTVKELVATVKADNQPAVAVTDHAICAAHPELAKLAKEAGIHPIFGIEANITDDRFLRGDLAIKDHAKFVRGDYRHLVMWAATNEGLRNLWAMSTEANLTGFYDRPRMDWAVLEGLNTDVMASTACLRGPISQRILAEDEEGARTTLARLLQIFDGRLWIELHTNAMPEQKLVNVELVRLAQEYGVPTIAAVDSHYSCAADQHTHRVWIASHTKKSLADDADLFAGNHEYHLMTEAEVRRSLDYLPLGVVEESIAHTREVAQRCNATVEGKRVMPVFSRKGGAEADVGRLVDLCLANWEIKITARTLRRHGVELAEVYMARFDREMKLLADKGYCGYYLMTADQVNYAKENGILVGPGRGSGGGSLVAYLCGITEIDPIEADLLFERFLTEGRDSPPDFDVDYPTSKRDFMQDYCVERWGPEYVVRVGTHMRLKNKGVVKDVAAALKGTPLGDAIHWPDLDAISKIIDEAEVDTAGKGMKWEDLWDVHGDVLNPYREKYPELFALADRLVGRLKTYGRHAAGVVISMDDPITNRLPLRSSENSNQPITEFDMDALELLGFLKGDILTLRNLDTLQMCVDLIAEHYGRPINLYQWIEEYDDPQVWDEISDGNTLGIFQIETPAGTKLVKQFRPRSIADLADVITLVRPGPVRSGLTASYFRRRDGREAVTLPDPRLAEKLAPTQGCIIYQEQVMSACQILGNYTLAEADEVRRILGKKKVEEVQKAGEEFISRCSSNGMSHQNATDLWEKLGEFAKYSFNKSHAWGYALIGYWLAWLKINYPSMFLTAILSTVPKDRIPDFVREARRMGYKVLPPDINVSGKGFRPDGGLAVRYGLDAIKGIGEVALEKITTGQPYESVADFRERSGVDSGIVRLLASVGAFDTLESHRYALEQMLAWQAAGDDKRCVHWDPSVIAPHGLPCTFDWESEPIEIGLSGRPKQPKPPPKRCTIRCRNYTARPRPDFESAPMYTDAETRQREKELLGIFLSSTPFDRVPQEVRDELCSSYADVMEGKSGDIFIVATMIAKIRPNKDRNGKPYAFLSLDAEGGMLDVVCFADNYKRFGEFFETDALCIAKIGKNDRGLQLLNCSIV